MSRDTVDLLGDLIADHYSGDSVQTMVPPISTLLAAQDELVKLRLKVIEQGGRLNHASVERDLARRERDRLSGRLDEIRAALEGWNHGERASLACGAIENIFIRAGVQMDTAVERLNTSTGENNGT